MSDDLVVDAEIVEPMDKPAAERLDKRIRLLVGAIEENLTKLNTLVVQAKSGQIHVALGFKSWTAYVADVFTLQVRLDRPQRRELVGWLSGEGMSQRVIADVVGVDQKTVSNDLRAGEEFSSPEPGVDELISQGVVADVDEYRDIMAMAEMSGDEFEEALADARSADDLSRENVARICRERTEEKKQIVGRDGKTYTKSESKPPRRKPIADAMGTATYDLGKVVKRLVNLAADDRFGRNQQNLALDNYGSLIRLRDDLNTVISKLGDDDE